MSFYSYKNSEVQNNESCPNQCVPGEYYLPTIPPTWKSPDVTAPKDAYCAAALMGNSQNNCYNKCYNVPMPCYSYGMNVVTPKPWTYPGMRNSNSMPDVNNCSDLIKQTVSDGSTFSASLPTSLPAGTHLMAAYAAGGEYHYARYDADTKLWSSKNGHNPPNQLDSNNNLITDASKATFVLFGQKLDFCGYFITGPSMVCPNPGMPGGCVQGEPQYTAGTSYPGCGIPTSSPFGPF
jgi:hypothetical protein